MTVGAKRSAGRPVPRQALRRRMQELFGGVQPVAIRPAVAASLGGPDPLESVDAWATASGHWLLVSMGACDLDARGTGPNLPFELTLCVVRDDDAPPVWAADVVQTLVRYVLDTGNRFEAGHHFDLQRPLDPEASIAQTGGLLVRDPVVGTLQTSRGPIETLRVVGLAADEVAAADAGRTPELIECLRTIDPHLATDARRASLVGTLPELVSRTLALAVERDAADRGVGAERLEVDATARALDLGGRKLRSIELPNASDCPRLAVLELFDNTLTTIDLEPLRGHGCLEELYLQGNRLRQVDLSPLAEVPRLRRVSLAANEIEHLDLSALAAARELTTLALADNALMRVDLSALRACGWLAVVDVSQNRLRTLDLSPLADAHRLVELSVWNNPLAAELDLRPLADKQRLQSLFLHGCGLARVDLAPLRAAGSLRKLELGANRLQRIDLTPLAECRALDHLFLYENELVELSLEGIRNARGLKLLDLGGNRLEAIDLSPLATARQLVKLDLGQNRLRRVDVGPLVGCSHLRNVGVDDDVELVAPASHRTRTLPQGLRPLASRIAWEDG